jgi:hypothetical protein
MDGNCVESYVSWWGCLADVGSSPTIFSSYRWGVGIGVTVLYPHPQVVDLEKLMIITKAIITYRCDHCGRCDHYELDYISNFTPLSPGDITKTNNPIDKTKQCTACARHITIEKAVFKTRQNNEDTDI